MKFIQELKALNYDVWTRKLQRTSNKEVIEKKKRLLENLKLCQKCMPTAKQNCINCLGLVKKKEKGVDIQIAVDMITGAYNNEYDYAILLSGDGDFISVLKLIEQLKKMPLSSGIMGRYAYDLRKGFKAYFLTREGISSNCLK